MPSKSKREIERQIAELRDADRDTDRELRQQVPVALVEEWLQVSDADPESYEWFRQFKERINAQ